MSRQVLREFIQQETSKASETTDLWLSWLQISSMEEYKIIAKNRTFRARSLEFYSYIDNGYLEGLFENNTSRRVGYVKKSELDSFIKYMNKLECEYIGDREFLSILGWKKGFSLQNPEYKKSISDTIFSLCDSEGIECLYFDILIDGSQFYINRGKFNHFLDNHISRREVLKKYGIRYGSMTSIIERHGIKEKVFNRHNVRFFLKEDIKKYFKEKKYFNTKECFKVENQFTEISEGRQLYRRTEACEILGITQSQFYSLIKEVNIAPVIDNRLSKYLKSSIDKLREAMDELLKKYCTSEEARTILGVSSRTKVAGVKPVISAQESTLLMMCTFGKASRISLFSREEVVALRKQRDEQEIIEKTYDNYEPLEAFYSILKIKQINFSKNSKVTEKEWLLFCEERLSSLNGAYWHIRRMISAYITITEQLVILTRDGELYSYRSSELELRFFKTNENWKVQKVLWDFLVTYENKLKYYAEVKGSSTKLYNLSRISTANPYKREREFKKPTIKEIYSYNEFKAFYDFAQDMNHKKKAILDAERIINGKSREELSHYASAWLFVLVHLTNAWRQPDILQIPEIDLEEVGIFSLDTLKERDLTLKETNKVINQLCKKTITITKTLVDHQFYCAEDLELPIATAAIICTIISRKTTRMAESPIIGFGTKGNKFEATLKSYETFFENINTLENLEGFRFLSQKMNRTVLVLTYMVLAQKGKGSAAFKIAQKLRAHISEESTNIYMTIPQEEMDRICSNIFSRRMFGYIPSLLAGILIGETTKYDQKTKEIITINEKFGDVYKIEATTGYINKVLAERESVAKYIFDLGIDGALDLLFELNAGLLPSKEKNIQCLISSKGCPYQERSCKNCHLSIPNFYALSAFAKSVEVKMLDFFDKYSPECYEAEKTFLFNTLFVQLDNLERACQKFGSDEVMSFFEGGKERYNDLIVKIFGEESIASYEDTEKYMTYQPTYLQ
ncbi:hypothetical protein H7S74_13250 [Priestia aryabhattai]|uniref:hypothetical protein n=1 Tax=Priestia aryabhattai TaxID=412384 RepID=UPI001EB68B1E|nr:hypothetical protein [Priestia aryabhattai]MBY0091428.1 hypothetical protein [Priestia aryabhattai]MBY0102317.1 hypothetical protein [Priestia aryabhattai]